jgi:hypothetical protein
MDAALVLTVLSAGSTGPEMVVADTLIGFDEGVVTAKIAGASNRSALVSGAVGAAISGTTAFVSAWSRLMAAQGIVRDARDGDPIAQLNVELGDVDNIAKQRAFPLDYESNSVGPNGANDFMYSTGAYNPDFPGGGWWTNHVPFAHYGGLMQDAIDFNPEGKGKLAWLGWGGFLVTVQSLNIEGAVSASGASALIVHDVAYHQ